MVFYILSCLVLIGATVGAKLVKKKPWPVIFYSLLGVSFIASFIAGAMVGRELFSYDNPSLGMWIFLMFTAALSCGVGFALTYKVMPKLSMLLLGLAFAFAFACLIMCIYEAKEVFANGINSSSPGNSSEPSETHLLF